MNGFDKIEPNIKKGQGGRRPGSGRKKGSPNKATSDVRHAAQEHTGTALQTLVDIATDEDAPLAARVAASNALLDRGHGKPSQAIEGTGENGAIVVEIVKFGGGNRQRVGAIR